MTALHPSLLPLSKQQNTNISKASRTLHPWHEPLQDHCGLAWFTIFYPTAQYSSQSTILPLSAVGLGKAFELFSCLCSLLPTVAQTY